MWPDDDCTVQLLAQFTVHIHLIFSPSPSRLLVLSEGTVILCAVRANSGIAPVILNDVTRWRKMVSFMHWLLYPKKNSSTLRKGVQEGDTRASPDIPQARTISCLSQQSEPRLSSPQSSHCTDRVIWDSQAVQQQYSAQNVTLHK